MGVTAATSLNTSPPPPEGTTVSVTLEVGWEHEIVDGVLRYTLDDDGERIPRPVVIPVCLPPLAWTVAGERLGSEQIAALQAGDTSTGLLVDAIECLLPGLPMQVGLDPTVAPEDFVAFLWTVIDILFSPLDADPEVATPPLP